MKNMIKIEGKINKIIAVTVTILLGAIGSGIWDWILSDAILWLGHALLTLFGALSQAYVDTLYSHIGKGSEFFYLSEIHVLVFVIYLALPVLLVMTRRKILRAIRGEEDKEKEDKAPVHPAKPILLLLFIVTLLAIQIIQTSHKFNVANGIERSIDIVSPHISEKERKELLAQYRLVNDEKSLAAIVGRLNALSNTYSVELPSISVL